MLARKLIPKIRKILLIEPPNNLFVGFNATVLVEPLGLEYIAGSISDLADVKIHDMRVDSKPLKEVLYECQPDLVGIKEGYTVDVQSVKEVARQVKEINPDALVVVGGHHVSLSPQDAFTKDIDAIVIGDGEDVFREMVEKVNRYGDLSQVQRYAMIINNDISYRIRRFISRDEWESDPSKIFPLKAAVGRENKPGCPIAISRRETDSLYMNSRPKPLRALVDGYRKFYHFLYHISPFSIETTKGCQYRCSFCSVWVFHTGEHKEQSVYRTMEDLASLPPNSWVNLVDDLAFQYPATAMQFAKEVTQLNCGHRFWAQVRADNVVRHPKEFEALASAGLDTVLIGLESVSQKELNEYRKGSKVDDNLKAISFLKSLGVRIWGTLMVRPSWTEDDFKELEEFVYSTGIDYPNYTIHTPLPGTPDYKLYQEQLITENPTLFDFLHTVMQPKLKPQDFYEKFASLWRTVGEGGLGRVRGMVQEVSTSRDSVIRFLKQYKTLSKVETYQRGIELLERHGSEAKA